MDSAARRADSENVERDRRHVQFGGEQTAQLGAVIKNTSSCYSRSTTTAAPPGRAPPPAKPTQVIAPQDLSIAPPAQNEQRD
jgi:hypothetical protein